ncbi:MAG: DNA mismatch repair endonuclease MutL [Acutalibacteraceae bacterium]
MSIIRVLPKNISDLIAAGEVVEQPASVVKELFENSVDAGATNIVIEINNGGKAFIRVTDNASGIPREFVKTAFLSHATSKITGASDLDCIKTLGFRGEALSSICAVSKVDVLTRTKNEQVGTHYIIEGGEEKLFDDAGCPPGTTVSVRSLFYNVPARMKFLKKDVSEGNSVNAVLQRLAIAHTEIAVKFIRDGKTVFQTFADGKLQTVLRSLFGKEMSDCLQEVEHTLGGVCVRGLVSLPHLGRGSRSMQFFFINGRTVKSPVITAALEGGIQ